MIIIKKGTHYKRILLTGTGFFISPNPYIDYFINLFSNQIAGIATLGFINLYKEIIEFNLLWYIVMIALFTIYRSIVKEFYFKYNFKKIIQTGSASLFFLWIIFFFLADYLPGIHFTGFFNTFLFVILFLIMAKITTHALRILKDLIADLKIKRK